MKKPPYDKDALQQNIEKCRENIKIFQAAIEKEYQTITLLEAYIRDIEEYEEEHKDGDNI